MKQIYVITYTPADGQGGLGGWRWTADPRVAEARYTRDAMDSAWSVRMGEPGHVVRLVPVKVPVADLRAADVHDLVEWELPRIESLIPAARQYVPPTTTPAHVPAGVTHEQRSKL